MSDIKKLLETIRNADDFRACVYAMEAEASERYAELADQMEVHNNREVAALFRRLSEIEGIHAKKILGESQKPGKAASMYSFLERDGAESISVEDLHYLMTPHHALSLTLRGEQKAAEFFEALATQATDQMVRRLAAEMAAEEREHVELVKSWLKKYPEPDPDWEHDPDPPMLTE